MPNDILNLNLFETTVNLELEEASLCNDLIKAILPDELKKINLIFSNLFNKKLLTGIDPKVLIVEQFLINLEIVSDETIQQLNLQYRKKDKTTDVLSFPVHEDLRNFEKENFVSGPFLLGDIFICESVAQKQANESGLDLKTELIELYIHGVLHLMGYDHEISSEEEKIMYDLEHLIYDQFKDL